MRGLKVRFTVGQSSLGVVLVAATHVGGCAILLGGDPRELVEDLVARFPQAELRGGDGDFESLVVRLVAEPWKPLDPAQQIHRTASRSPAWNTLRRAPAGQTVDRLDLAKAHGRPKSARAVAWVCAANPLAVAIPCHRIVRTDGGAGYRWGIRVQEPADRTGGPGGVHRGLSPWVFAMGLAAL